MPSSASPELTTAELPKGADVVVVGAGIVGTACAGEIAARGASVVVLEKEGAPGREGSGRAQGSLRVQGRQAPELPLALRSREIWLEEGEDNDFELVMDGNIYLCDDDSERPYLERLVAIAHDQGLSDVRLLGSDEARELMPAATGPFSCAMYSPVDGHCQPEKATQHFAARAVRAGAKLAYGVKAVDLLTTGGRISGVRTDRGDVDADRVVVACGVWTPYLVASVGVNLPIMPVVLYQSETEPLPPLFAQSIRSFHFSGRQRPDGRVVLGAGLGARVSHEVSFYDIKNFAIWFPRLRRFKRDVRLRVGSRQILNQIRTGSTLSTRLVSVAAGEPRADHKQMDRAFEAAGAVIPGLRQGRLGRYWGGFIDMSPDGLPVVDAQAGPAGLVIVAGLSGHGLAIGPALGEVAADLALEGSTVHDIAPLRLERYAARDIPVPEKII